jgi:hypothetical protein
MRARWLVAAGVLAFAVSLLLRVPAALAYQWLDGRQQAAVRLHDIRGTAFRGEAKGVLFGDLVADQVRWRWSPAGLLQASFTLDTRIVSPTLSLQGRLGVAPGDRLAAERLNGRVPLSAVSRRLLGGPGPLQGNLEPDQLDLSWRQGALSGIRGNLYLRSLQLPQPTGPAIPLGDVLLSFAGEGSPWRGEIRDDGGPVRLAGQLSISADGAYALNLLASAREQGSPQAAVLATLGAADAEGRHRLSLAGAL